MKHSIPILTALAVFSKCAWAIPPQSRWYSTLKSPNERFVLNAEQATVAVQSAVAVAESNNAPSSIVVMDPYGYIINLLRMDHAWVESIDTCIRKTRTVTLFNGAFTSGDLQPLVQPGKEDYGLEHTNDGMLPIPGAVPLYINGTFFAAIGVCGGSGQQDLDAAIAGVHAVNGTIEL
ncbi:Ff.00g064370.m01.CDS01 [Fusarium sp. VM40]|nr:Ff.00g064370.m01.CDS01 [Fusarium sp. VM40]